MIQQKNQTKTNKKQIKKTKWIKLFDIFYFYSSRYQFILVKFNFKTKAH